MVGKIKLVIILITILLLVLGVVYLFNNYSFYKKSQKTKAVITDIGRPDFCGRAGGCYWTRKVSLQFTDPNKDIIQGYQELFTPTLVSGVITTGNNIKVLYTPKPNNAPLLDRLVPNLGPTAYDVKIYTWHYWAYPILLILLGPIFYWAVKKLNNRRADSK